MKHLVHYINGEGAEDFTEHVFESELLRIGDIVILQKIDDEGSLNLAYRITYSEIWISDENLNFINLDYLRNANYEDCEVINNGKV